MKVLVELAALLLLLAGPAAAALPELREVPEPPLATLEVAVQQKLVAARTELEARRAETGDPVELAEAFYGLGRLYFLHEAKAAAAAAFDNASRLAPDDDGSFYFLGLLRQEAGDFAGAIAAFTQVVQLRAGNVAALVRLGELHLLRQELEAAETAFAQAAAAAQSGNRPEAAALFGLARVAQARREDSRALELLRQALALQPSASSLHHPIAQSLRRLGRLDEARAELAQAGSSMVVLREPLRESLLAENVSARALLVEGNRLRRRGQLEAAIERYRQGLELDPQEAALHYNLGLTLAGRGELGGAEQHFRAAITSRPGFRDAFFNLGICLREQRRYAEALAAFSQAETLAPADASSQLEKAITQDLAGDRAGARAALLRVAARLELSASEQQVLARYLIYVGERELGLEKLAAAASQDPGNAELAAELAENLGRAGRHREAAAALAKAAQLAPQNPRYRFGEVFAWAMGGDCPAARAAFTAARVALPQEPHLAEVEARLRQLCP